ncbi:MAG: FMN-binding protein [Gammaproteobacteria bacterium]|nr:FMN-binding protein [Gammaproteobacteria bacterium]
MSRLFFVPALLIALLMTVPRAWAEVYQSPEDFLHEVFAGDVPAPEVLWLTGTVRATAKQILGHDPAQLRVRYWYRDARSAWILEEIGKEQPITTGIVVAAGRIERMHVLVFRESRGWEVRHDFFTDQFAHLGLTVDRNLDGPIDGISGATLSVRALTRLARLALYLHQQIPAAHATP